MRTAKKVENGAVAMGRLASGIGKAIDDAAAIFGGKLRG